MAESDSVKEEEDVTELAKKLNIILDKQNNKGKIKSLLEDLKKEIDLINRTVQGK